MATNDERYDYGKTLIREAGGVAYDYFKSRDELKIESKGLQDVVSIADRNVEQLIRRRILERFPDDQILGEEEEGPAEFDPGRPIWVVDPIDGTQCFLSGIPTWCVSIGLVSGGHIDFGLVYDPNADELFAGGAAYGAVCNDKPIRASDAASLKDGMLEVGFSHRTGVDWTARVFSDLLKDGGMYHRSGSGALSLAYVAAGRYIGYFEEHMNSWDSFGAVPIIKAAGGWTNDVMAGDGLTAGSVVVACGPNLQAEIKNLIWPGGNHAK